LEFYFLPAPPPTQFLFLFFVLKLFYYLPLSPSDLLAYIFKLKVDSSPSTY
jgi:hypothetical protein